MWNQLTDGSFTYVKALNGREANLETNLFHEKIF